MKLLFSKMHGAGNSFVIANNINSNYPCDENFIKNICHPHRGIGGDGLIYILKSKKADFKMNFYNCDGSKADMCGNGLRCIAKYARNYLIDQDNISFETDAGILNTEIMDGNSVKIDIPILKEIEKTKINDTDIYYGNTGVPHAIVIKENLEKLNVKKIGCEIRNDNFFSPEGINVNFIQFCDDGKVKIRTYERGVEDETLACGTGITACGLTLYKYYNFSSPITFITKDQDVLTVDIEDNKVCLTGEAIEIGEINFRLLTSDF